MPVALTLLKKELAGFFLVLFYPVRLVLDDYDTLRLEFTENI
jgi:hypothetical protein